MKVMVIDTETGGFDPDKYSLMTVGGVIGDIVTGEVIEAKEWALSLPEYKFTAEAMEVNKLNIDELRKTGKKAEDIASELSSMYIRNGITLLAGHNLKFDIRFLCKQLFRISESEFEREFTRFVFDTQSISVLFQASKDIKLQSGSLSQTAKALGIKKRSGSLHNALVDALLCFDVFHKFYTTFNTKSVLDAFEK